MAFFEDIVHLGNIDEIKKILSSGVNPNQSNNDEEDTALHYAVRMGRIDIVKLLVKNGANPNQNNLKNETSVHDCCRLNRLEILLYFIDKGADINVLNKKDVSPIEMATINNNHEIVDVLMKRKICSDSINISIVYAIDNNNIVALSHLIPKGKILNEKVEREFFIFDKMLMSRRDDINHKDLKDVINSCCPLLYYSIMMDKIDVVKFLVNERGCKITYDFEEYERKPPFYNMISSIKYDLYKVLKNTEIVEFLRKPHLSHAGYRNRNTYWKLNIVDYGDSHICQYVISDS